VSHPTPVPDSIDEANANFGRHHNLESIMAGAEPLHEDESFEIPDITGDEWAVFEQAIHE
jgi:hypothetical protein